MKARTVARWGTFAIWAGVAASAALWGLRLFSPGQPVPAHATSVSGSQSLRGDPVLLLGRAKVPQAAPVVVPPAPARFKLIGVLAPRGARAAAEGLALIAIDDKPPKAYRVGAVVDGDLVLQRVRARGVDLGPRGSDQPRMALQAPQLTPSAGGAGSLPAQLPRTMPIVAPRMPPMQVQAPPAANPADLEGEPDAAPPSEGESRAPNRPGAETQ
jgi:general secretion pathway protein C